MFKKIPVSEVFNLSDYIEVEAKKTISNNILSRDDIEMELFSLGVGESISKMKTFKDTIFINLLSEVKFIVDEVEYMIGVNEGFIVKNKSSVEIIADDNAKFLKISIDSKLDFDHNLEAFDDLIKVISTQVANMTLGGNKILNVALLALDENEKLSTHAAGGDAFVFVLEGETEIVIEGKPFHLKKGNSILMPKNIPHSVLATKPYRMLLIVAR